MGPASLVRRLRAWPRRLRAAFGVVRRGGPRVLAARLRELHRAGCLRVVTPGPGGAPALLTLVFADGDVITRATPGGLALVDAHRRALDRLADDLTPAPDLVAAVAPLLLLPFVVICVGDLLFGPAMAAARGPLEILAVIARDLLVVIALPATVIWLLGQAMRLWVRRRLRL